MPALPPEQLMQAHCKVTGRWGILIHCPWPEGMHAGDLLEGIRQAAPMLNTEERMLLAGGVPLVLLYPSKEDCKAAYKRIVGDDGPTPENPYNGPVRVSAVTCDNVGNLVNENS